MKYEALEKAITVAGGQAALGRKAGVPQSYVSYWLHKARRGVSAEHVLAIERAVDGAVKRHELRPDIYPTDEQTGV